jgi:hypothetical protein
LGCKENPRKEAEGFPIVVTIPSLDGMNMSMNISRSAGIEGERVTYQTLSTAAELRWRNGVR